jgi:predicted nucleotidyltransferase
LGGRREKVIFYGSYARGDYDEYSDVDIFVQARGCLRTAERELAADSRRFQFIAVQCPFAESLL